jgi:transcription termination factor Rho
VAATLKAPSQKKTTTARAKSAKTTGDQGAGTAPVTTPNGDGVATARASVAQPAKPTRTRKAGATPATGKGNAQAASAASAPTAVEPFQAASPVVSSSAVVAEVPGGTSATADKASAPVAASATPTKRRVARRATPAVAEEQRAEQTPLVTSKPAEATPVALATNEAAAPAVSAGSTAPAATADAQAQPGEQAAAAAPTARPARARAGRSAVARKQPAERTRQPEAITTSPVGDVTPPASVAAQAPVASVGEAGAQPVSQEGQQAASADGHATPTTPNLAPGTPDDAVAAQGQAPAGPRPQQGGQRPAFRSGGQPSTGRPANGTRPQQPFAARGPQGTGSPAQGQNEYGNGQMDGQHGRRRRRRRGGGRGTPGTGPAMSHNGTPMGTQQPTSPGYQAPAYAQAGYAGVEERQSADFAAPQRMPVFEVQGTLDFLPNGEAFLREPDLRERSDDPLIGVRDVRRFDLRNGDMVRLEVRPGRGRGPVVMERVITLNGIPFEEMRPRPRFEDLTAVYPDRMIKLETGQFPLTTRMLDLIAPVGFGQRALIVSPPKAGKTTLLKNIGQGVITNYPTASLILCLVGERPEEVTDLRLSLPKAEMFASSFDEEVERHGHLAEMALERARRLAEQGKDVVVLLDSITRLARAYNLGGGGGGRTLSGGMDATALTTARRIFGAARAIEQGGSLTIIATCLVDTGSRLDDVVYEEFKGTGNMELHLDRQLAERRIFPAIDITKSSTRKEELLLDPTTLQWMVLLRRRLAGGQMITATEQLIDRLSKTPSNRTFLEMLARAAS